jgi:hypothetical protein
MSLSARHRTGLSEAISSKTPATAALDRRSAIAPRSSGRTAMLATFRPSRAFLLEARRLWSATEILRQVGSNDGADRGGYGAHRPSDEKIQTAASATATAFAKDLTGWHARARVGILKLLTARDLNALPSRASFALIMQAGSELALHLWELPPADVEPFRHRLGDAVLILVLEGSPRLDLPPSSRRLSPGEVAVSGGDLAGGELVSDGQNVVRFLAFTGGAEVPPAIETDRRPLIPGASTALPGARMYLKEVST